VIPLGGIDLLEGADLPHADVEILHEAGVMIRAIDVLVAALVIKVVTEEVVVIPAMDEMIFVAILEGVVAEIEMKMT